MNVRCPNCQSAFRVDPERVPAAGIKARCSRCSSVFQLTREGVQRPAMAAVPSAPPAPAPGAARLHIQYITQAGIRPPMFVLFTSGGGQSKGGLHFSYLRYVENRLREEFEFFATPVKLIERHKTKGKSKSKR